MKTAIYLRKSRAEEITDTLDETLLKHKESLLKFAAQNNLMIVSIYEEVVSGESLYARPQMLRLLEDIEKRLYEAVLCMDIDRLGRGAMSDQGIILETFKNANVKIVTPRKIYDLNNELDEEYTEFETFIARRELKLIKRRMQRGKIKTAEDGGYISNPPFGYDRAHINKKPTLSINEKEAHFVHMAFDMYVNQCVGCQIIANTLSSLGAVPRRGKAFNRNSVRFMLKNPVYIGKVVWNRQKYTRKGQNGNSKQFSVSNPESVQIAVDGSHPAIITEELFNRAQTIREQKIRPPYNRGILRNQFAGLLVCRACGLNLRMAPFKKELGTTCILCSTKGCVMATRFDHVEDALMEGIRENLEVLTILKESIKTNQGVVQVNNTLELLKKEILINEQQKDKLHDLLEQGIYTIDVFIKRLSSLNEKRIKLQESESILTDKLNEYLQIDVGKIIEKIENVLQLYYATTDVKLKNELLKSIIHKVLYYKAKGSKPEQFELDIYLKDIY